MDKLNNFMVAMGCIRLDIIDNIPSKHSSDGFFNAFSNCKPITKKCVSTYTFGFNDKEYDPELKGTGNHYTTFFRQYDPRLGRWFSVDPKNNYSPWESPYISFHNNPIVYIVPKGYDPYKKAIR